MYCYMPWFCEIDFCELWDLMRGPGPVWFINTCGILFRSSEIKAENGFLMLSISSMGKLIKM